MLNKIAIAVVLIVGTVATVTAAPTWAEWIANTTAGIQTKKTGIKELERTRDSVCGKQATVAYREACLKGYNIIVMRARAEQEELEFAFATLALSEEDRNNILGNVIPSAIYNERDNDTTRVYKAVQAIFIPKQTTRR